MRCGFLPFGGEDSLIHQFAASVLSVDMWVCGDVFSTSPSSSRLSEHGAGCGKVSQRITSRLQTTRLVNSENQLTRFEHDVFFFLSVAKSTWVSHRLSELPWLLTCSLPHLPSANQLHTSPLYPPHPFEDMEEFPLEVKSLQNVLWKPLLWIPWCLWYPNMVWRHAILNLLSLLFKFANCI